MHKNKRSRTQRSPSPGPSTKNRFSQRASSQIASRTQNGTLQQTLEQTFAQAAASESKVQEMCHKIVRYVILRANAEATFNKSDLVKNVLGNESGRNQYNVVIERAMDVLKRVYGYELIQCDGKSPSFIVCNNLAYIAEKTNEEEIIGNEEYPSDIHKALIMLILTHVFMSNGSATDVSLFSFLRSIDIDVDLKHPLFGDVKNFITKKMVKEKYITIESEDMPKRNIIKFGIRAEYSVDKSEILNFVSKIYGDKDPKSWKLQYESTQQQKRENEIMNSM